jgi:uncharacterized membrane protein
MYKFTMVHSTYWILQPTINIIKKLIYYKNYNKFYKKFYKFLRIKNIYLKRKYLKNNIILLMKKLLIYTWHYNKYQKIIEKFVFVSNLYQNLKKSQNNIKSNNKNTLLIFFNHFEFLSLLL